MNKIKSSFSIKDLENLSGIKSHTIRIWEKRYGLLEPERTQTNIRRYNLKNLKKLLNIQFLNTQGIKISKIAALSEKQIPELASKLSHNATTDSLKTQNDFKLSMFHLNETLFNKVYKNLKKKYTFSEIFYNYFLPFLNNIGMLWQTNTITPIHEHFIVELIKRKLIFETELISKNITINTLNKTQILFLPENEIHEMGLLFANYELQKKGYPVIYLGQSIPLSNLKDILKHYSACQFISCFTIAPNYHKINSYLSEFYNYFLKEKDNNLLISGLATQHISNTLLNKQIKPFNSIKNLLTHIE